MLITSRFFRLATLCKLLLLLQLLNTLLLSLLLLLWIRLLFGLTKGGFGKYLVVCEGKTGSLFQFLSFLPSFLSFDCRICFSK
jgi:hypothetical protein